MQLTNFERVPCCEKELTDAPQYSENIIQIPYFIDNG